MAVSFMSMLLGICVSYFNRTERVANLLETSMLLMNKCRLWVRTITVNLYYNKCNITYYYVFASGERYNNVVGHVDSESAMKREVVHRLCLGDMSRSELIRRLSYAESEVSARNNPAFMLYNVLNSINSSIYLTFTTVCKKVQEITHLPVYTAHTH